jgi:hypothetical protein
LEYFAASVILNVYLSNYVIDEISFYVYDAGCVIATTFAKRPFQGTDRGQNLMFHEFIHLWVGYKLVKVFQAYGLQPRSVNSMLKTWSPDFFDVFTYLKNESTLSESQQKNAEKIIQVLFLRTKYNGHFARVQFGGKKKLMENHNFKLSLIILTWLRQLQQYFLTPVIKNSPKGDWNKYGKNCGVSTTPMAKNTPLANINFSKIESSEEKEVINNVSQFKPEEGTKGVCTSLEEWAFLILKPNVVQGRVADNKSETNWARMLKGQPKFIISNIDFTKDSNPPTDKSKAASLTTNATDFNNIQKEELALNVSKLITDLVTKADKKINDHKKISGKEMGCMKLLYNAASSLTAFVNKFNDNLKYKDLNEMHQELLESLEESKMPAKESLDQNNDDDDNNEYDNISKNEHTDDYNEEDGNSTDTEQESRNRKKRKVGLHVENSEESKDSSEDDTNKNSE